MKEGTNEKYFPAIYIHNMIANIVFMQSKIPAETKDRKSFIIILLN